MGKTIGLLLFLPVALFLMLAAKTTDAAENGCLTCHGETSIQSGGGHLYVDAGKYSLTTHARIGCPGCHAKVTKGHPADGLRPSRATCKECHAAVFTEYDKSLHGKKAGCTDCHNPHAAKPLLSVSARDINVQCAKCHEHSQIVRTHAKWLPQAALHIDALPCITCHTGSEKYVITLYIAKKEGSPTNGGSSIADFEDLKSLLLPGQKIGDLIDGNGDGLVSLKELKSFNTSGQYKNFTLLGTMMPEVTTHSYQILDNRWDCTFCHVSGSNASQTSFLAFPDKEGTYSRIAVEKGAILDILYGTPDFYMLGATRSTTLSILGALIAAGGLLVPIVHGSIRLATRKKRKEQ